MPPISMGGAAGIKRVNSGSSLCCAPIAGFCRRGRRGGAGEIAAEGAVEGEGEAGKEEGEYM